MLIEFSRDLSDEFKGLAGDWRYLAIEYMAKLAKTHADIKWARTTADGEIHRVRFTLPAADERQHDEFINGIFGLDPDAKIKTARATYEDCSDYLSQRAARLP